MTKITLGDPAIAEIARLVQLAILTGTDVTDQLRTLSLTVENDVLYPHPDFTDYIESSINRLLQDAETIQAEA
jgi:hypothetical protein